MALIPSRAHRIRLLVVAGGEAEGLEGGLVGARVVYLEGGVRDPKLLGEELFEIAAAGVAILVVADEHVGREGREA